MKKDIFPEKDIEELRIILMDILNKSDWTGSARGSHYEAIAWLRKHGIHKGFTGGREIEDYISHIVTYNQIPEED
ncbi:MAG: hypothetical protein R2941_03250 [Desulfobacterales bacterium]